MRVGPRFQVGERLLERIGPADMNAEIRIIYKRALREVGVRIVETRHDELVAILADLGVLANVGRDRRIIAAREDLAVGNRDTAGERLAAIACENRVALQNQLCRSHDVMPPSAQTRKDA